MLVYTTPLLGGYIQHLLGEDNELRSTSHRISESWLASPYRFPRSSKEVEMNSERCCHLSFVVEDALSRSCLRLLYSLFASMPMHT